MCWLVRNRPWYQQFQDTKAMAHAYTQCPSSWLFRSERFCRVSFVLLFALITSPWDSLSSIESTPVSIQVLKQSYNYSLSLSFSFVSLMTVTWLTKRVSWTVFLFCNFFLWLAIVACACHLSGTLFSFDTHTHNVSMVIFSMKKKTTNKTAKQ